MLPFRHFLWAILLLASLIPVLVEAAPAEGTTQAAGHPEVVFEGGTSAFGASFVIKDASGKILFNAKGYSAKNQISLYEKDSVRWNSDGSVMALAGGAGSHLLLTHVFALSHGSFTPVAVPSVTGEYDNPWVLPLKWLPGRRLVVAVSGPHAGKAGRNGAYLGRATLHFPLQATKGEVHYHHLIERPADSEE